MTAPLKDAAGATAGPASVAFGWGAPPMAEQFPSLPAAYAKKFDDLNKAVIMCHLHGLISDSVRDSAIKKCTRQISAALSRAASHPTTSGEPT